MRQHCRQLHFYPRSPCGERLSGKFGMVGVAQNFYPRSPCGERPFHTVSFKRSPYFYPRSPCGERRGYVTRRGQPFGISIHALLAESDAKPNSAQHTRTHFYPRSPCGERPLVTTHVNISDQNFYPRSPCGERRHPPKSWASPHPYFYPRSPCGERLGGHAPGLNLCTISIHALLAESD